MEREYRAYHVLGHWFECDCSVWREGPRRLEEDVSRLGMRPAIHHLPVGERTDWCRLRWCAVEIGVFGQGIWACSVSLQRYLVLRWVVITRGAGALYIFHACFRSALAS